MNFSAERWSEEKKVLGCSTADLDLYFGLRSRLHSFGFPVNYLIGKEQRVWQVNVQICVVDAIYWHSIILCILRRRCLHLQYTGYTAGAMTRIYVRYSIAFTIRKQSSSYRLKGDVSNAQIMYSNIFEYRYDVIKIFRKEIYVSQKLIIPTWYMWSSKARWTRVSFLAFPAMVYVCQRTATEF